MFCRRFLPAAATLAALLSAAGARAQQTAAPDNTARPHAAQPESTETLSQPNGTPRSPQPGLPEVKFSNFTSCPIAEIQIYVPELAHLEPAQDQSQLNTLLDRIGAKAIEIANRTPNLVSREIVVSQNGQTKTKQRFSYLVLQHRFRSDAVIFDEYRVDVATGEKFETEFGKMEAASEPPGQSPNLTSLPIPSQIPSVSNAPMSKGFVGAWLYFYPSNRRLLDFRYLGREKMHHSQTLVFSFAQKRGNHFSGVMVEFEGKNYPVFVQGVAWVDADFRIVRLETDLLSLPAALPLHQLISDIEFALFPIAEVPAPLWLPREVKVAAILGGVNLHEDHTYSDYRLFRTRSKLVLK